MNIEHTHDTRTRTRHAAFEEIPQNSTIFSLATYAAKVVRSHRENINYVTIGYTSAPLFLLALPWLHVAGHVAGSGGGLSLWIAEIERDVVVIVERGVLGALCTLACIK